MILKAKHHFIIYPFFKWYARWQTRRKFSNTTITGDFTDRGLPLLLVANHVSWWDGFWAMVLNIEIFSRLFHFMMLEEQLKKHWYFNHSGGYSVSKKSRSILASLEYTRELLKNPGNLVLIFPQGEIQSMHRQHFRFEKGIGRISAGLESKIQVVMAVFLTDYFSRPKPGLYLYFREYPGITFDRDSLEKAYNQFFADCLEQQCGLND